MSEACEVGLREVEAGDVAVFFAQQLDERARWMAAFVGEDSADRAAFAARWTRILADASITTRTVLVDGAVAGHVLSFERLGNREVAYWLGREFWGRGIATAGLRLLLGEVGERPLWARVAGDNVGSRRVLEKCGFVVVETGRFFAHERGEEIEELVLRLE